MIDTGEIRPANVEEAIQHAVSIYRPEDEDSDSRWEMGEYALWCEANFGLGIRNKLADCWSMSGKQVEIMEDVALDFPEGERFVDATWGWHKACCLVGNAAQINTRYLAHLVANMIPGRVMLMGKIARLQGERLWKRKQIKVDGLLERAIARYGEWDTKRVNNLPWMKKADPQGVIDAAWALVMAGRARDLAALALEELKVELWKYERKAR
jgi:hypothetical protein